MRRVVVAVAAAGIAAGLAACSASGTQSQPSGGQPSGGQPSGSQPSGSQPSGGQPSGSQPSGSQPSGPPTGGGRATGTWAIGSCQVDVEYVDETNAVDHYVPDTGANFRHHFAGGNAGGNASLAVVVTLVNHTGGAASLPTGLIVTFTDQGGSRVGSPQTFNKANGTGYGAAVAGGRGSGEVFSSGTQFSPGQVVAESPDIGASVPPKPDLNCQVSRPPGGPSSS